jgi:hypothetical protein
MFDKGNIYHIAYICKWRKVGKKNKDMRALITLMLVFTYSCDIYAQADYILSGTVIKPSVSSLDKHGALLLNDSCAFHVVDKSGRHVIPDVCKWNFGVEAKQGNYVTVKNATSIDYGIMIDSSPYENSKPEYRRYTIENDSSTYFKGKVTFEGEYQGRKIQLDKEFYINLLPSIPKVKVLDVTWSNYDEQWNIYDDGCMTLQVNSCRAEYITSVEKDKYSHVALFAYFEPSIDAEKGIGLLEFYDGDRYFIFSADNFSGGVTSKDTLWNSQVATSIQTVKVESIPFYPNPVRDVLYVYDGMDAIFPVSIYDSKGRLVKYVGIPMNNIDISNLAEGIYFVSYKDQSSEKKLTFKMIKN